MLVCCQNQLFPHNGLIPIRETVKTGKKQLTLSALISVRYALNKSSTSVTGGGAFIIACWWRRRLSLRLRYFVLTVATTTTAECRELSVRTKHQIIFTRAVTSYILLLNYARLCSRGTSCQLIRRAVRPQIVSSLNFIFNLPR